MDDARRTSARPAPGPAPPPRTGARLYAMAGAAAFAASLGFSAYAYGVRFDAACEPWTPRGAARGLAVNIGLFSVFALHHSLLARSGARRWIARRLPDGVERATYVWIASLLFALTCAWWQPLPGALYLAEGLARAACLAVQASGILLLLRGGAALDPGELAGLRQAAAAGAGTGGERPQELRIRGPYRRLRHPLYAGLLLVLLGTPEMTSTRLSFALLSAAYIVAAIPWEERDMAARFGERYRRYRAAVRWRMVPGLY